MNEVRCWLERSAAWRAGSLMFTLPGPDGQSELGRLAETLPEDRRSLPLGFASLPLDDWEAEYHRVLGAGGCAACESSYEENALAGRGPVLARIAGYYEAFRYHPENPGSETPDHIAIEAGFLSYLALKIAFAEQSGLQAEKEIAVASYEKFRDEHPMHWMSRFAARLSPYDSPVFTPAADWLAAVR